MKEYGIQLYSLRDISKDDFEGMLKAVSEMGYKMVESAGFFGHSAKTVKGWLDKYGLTMCSTHTGYNLLADDFDATAKYHLDIGCKDLIIPGAAHGNMAEIDNLVEKINEWQPKLAAMGINLHYHNHWQEFVPNPDGSITMDELEKRTNVLFEIDTYWAYVAGEDPVKVLEKYGDRVKFIHLKDGFMNKEGKSLGQGTAPVKAVLAKAEATGRKIVVESEGLDPTGKEEVKRCIDFLMAQ
jgi:sugar phosphate isomerase/epimerase